MENTFQQGHDRDATMNDDTFVKTNTGSNIRRDDELRDLFSSLALHDSNHSFGGSQQGPVAGMVGVGSWGASESVQVGYPWNLYGLYEGKTY